MTNLIIYQRLRYFASILFNLLLASIKNLLFFLFLVIFNNFFTSPVHKENARLRLELVIPIAISITVANDAIEMLPLVTDKTIKTYQNK